MGSDDLLSSARVREIERIFFRALDVPTENRTEFLREASQGDEDRYREVSDLLAANAEAGDFLEKLDAAAAADLLKKTAYLQQKQIGPYSVVAEIGRGGMGVVYLAERTDGQFERQVALKLIKRGMDTESIISRFLNERQILARLEHPHIARLLDGGVTESGRPYFAMEFVDGDPLTAYCDEHALDVEARLELFTDVCRAVEYAHQNLVVHRDLKPSNILVKKDGQIKLLDFGIAKLLGPDHVAESTRGAFPVLTPEYAAPEQLEGQPITTATDVYALGVILYELLAGQRPPALKDARTGTDERLGPYSDPPPPSSLASISRRLRRRLSGDLDTIVLKALRIEPERRYASVEALREDLLRHISGRPVLAHPESFGYRLRKYVARHRAVAVAAVLVLLSLSTGLSLALVQARAKAAEAEKAEEVKNFVLSLFEHARPETSGGREITVRQMVDQGAARILTDLEGQPRIQTEMMALLGDIYISLDAYTEADQLLERSLGIRKALFGNVHPELAQSYFLLGKLRRHTGKYEEAESFLLLALAQRRESGQEMHRETAEILSHLAQTVLWVGRFEEARAYSREALRIRRTLFAPDHPLLAASLGEQAKIRYREGDYEEAIATYREALALLENSSRETYSGELPLLEGLALALQDQGIFEESERVARKQLDRAVALYGPDHSDVATVLHNLARLLKNQGKFAAADSMYRRALDVYRRALGDDHLYVAITMHDLGSLRLSQDDFSHADSLLRASLEIYRSQLGIDHAYVAMNMNTLGLLLMDTGALEEAEVRFRQAVTTYRKALPADHPVIGTSLIQLGRLLVRKGRPAEAEPALREVLRLWSAAFSETDRRTIEAHLELGNCLLALGRFDESEAMLEKARALAVDGFGPDHHLATQANAFITLLHEKRAGHEDS